MFSFNLDFSFILFAIRSDSGKTDDLSSLSMHVLVGGIKKNVLFSGVVRFLVLDTKSDHFFCWWQECY